MQMFAMAWPGPWGIADGPAIGTLIQLSSMRMQKSETGLLSALVR